MPAVLAERAPGLVVANFQLRSQERRPTPPEAISLPRGPERTIRNAVSSIISAQNPETGLLSAATSLAADNSAHMTDFWLRDHMEAVRALNNGVRQVTGGNTELGKQIDAFTVPAVKGVFELWGKDSWQKGFAQKVHTAPDGHTYLEDPDHAPPIHAKTSGEDCAWPTQNQPDAYGVSFTAIAQVLNNGVMQLDSREQSLLEQAIDYTIRLKPERIAAASMWEWGQELHSPTPLSTVAAVSKGLNDIQRFVRPGLKRQINATLQDTQEMIRANYPTDFTTREGHASRTDLATLYVMSTGALDKQSALRYFSQARRELLTDGMPGSIRFKGDHYHSTQEGEAVWFMGLPLSASVLFKEARVAAMSGNLSSAEYKQTMGQAKLDQADGIYRHYGFYPELHERRDGQYKLPDGSNGKTSDLVWNHAAMAQAAALSVLADRDVKAAKSSRIN